MTTKRRVLIAIPCLFLAGAASMFIAYLIDAPPVTSFVLGMAMCSTLIGRSIWKMRHY